MLRDLTIRSTMPGANGVTSAMDRTSRFSYQCNQCGRCCHNKVITLSPYDVLRMARATGFSTGEIVRGYTIRRGSILRFLPEGMCAALDGSRCTLHRGRPLACRLYPLGLERSALGDQLIALDPAEGSLGVYGTESTAGDFIDANETAHYLAALGRYSRLIPVFRERVPALVDFERFEPREFWRRAVVEALRENGCDSNPIIDAMFDPDAHGCGSDGIDETITAHIELLNGMARREGDGDRLAAGAVMLAVSLGYSPAEVIVRP
jgi:Fe-S-cluster containining protein